MTSETALVSGSPAGRESLLDVLREEGLSNTQKYLTTGRNVDFGDITIEITKNTKSDNISTALTGLDFDVSVI
jgi:hypothetical protein